MVKKVKKTFKKFDATEVESNKNVRKQSAEFEQGKKFEPAYVQQKLDKYFRGPRQEENESREHNFSDNEKTNTDYNWRNNSEGSGNSRQNVNHRGSSEYDSNSRNGSRTANFRSSKDEASSEDSGSKHRQENRYSSRSYDRSNSRGRRDYATSSKDEVNSDVTGNKREFNHDKRTPWDNKFVKNQHDGAKPFDRRRYGFNEYREGTSRDSRKDYGENQARDVGYHRGNNSSRPYYNANNKNEEFGGDSRIQRTNDKYGRGNRDSTENTNWRDNNNRSGHGNYSRRSNSGPNYYGEPGARSSGVEKSLDPENYTLKETGKDLNNLTTIGDWDQGIQSNDSNWTGNISLPQPDTVGTTDETFATPSPLTSTLNPEAHSFGPPMEKWSEMCLTEEAIWPDLQPEAGSITKNCAVDDPQKTPYNFHGNKVGEAMLSTTVDNTQEDKLNEKPRMCLQKQSTPDNLDSTLNSSIELKPKEPRKDRYSDPVVSKGPNVWAKINISQSSETSIRSTDIDDIKSDSDSFGQNWRSHSEKGKPRTSNDRLKNESLSGSSPSVRKSLGRRSLNAIFHKSEVETDPNMKDFEYYLQSGKLKNFNKVTEVDQNLFSVEEDYALAHCVAEDLRMGSGIAVEFRRRFKKQDYLLGQDKCPGLTYLRLESGRYIYYLLTKKLSSGKPTYGTLWKSLQKLKAVISSHDVKKLAIPRIGCGLDRLDWDVVKPMVEFIFKDSSLEILVCNFQQDETASPSVPRWSKECKIVRECCTVSKIAEETIIIYFASKDGNVSETMYELDSKFHYLLEFKKTPKNLGEPVRFAAKNNYILYGCIVKENVNDPFDFILFNKCLGVIQKNNKKDGYYYVAFQRIQDETDDFLTEKVLTLMRYSLRDVDIYVCNSKELEE